MKTKIFAYKNVLGIESSDKVEGIIAKPGNGNIGVVVRADACEITTEAKEMFKNAKREGGSFAPTMLTKHSNPTPEHGKSSIGWMGGYLFMCEANQLLLGRDCDKSVLDDMVLNDKMEIPEEFKKAIETEV